MLAGLLVAAAGACGDDTPRISDVPGGDPRRGNELVSTYACGSCHRVPGVDGADGHSAPPLDHYARRAYVAGIMVNTPENLVRWIRAPQEVQPGNGMPNLGVSEQDARDIAAYLRTLD